MSTAGVTEVDMKQHNHGADAKPEIASRLQQESDKLNEKRRSLTKDDLSKKMAEADSKRKEQLEEKIQTAKRLEGHTSPRKEAEHKEEAKAQ